jgi:hypothetical protein
LKDNSAQHWVLSNNGSSNGTVIDQSWVQDTDRRLGFIFCGLWTLIHLALYAATRTWLYHLIRRDWLHVAARFTRSAHALSTRRACTLLTVACALCAAAS